MTLYITFIYKLKYIVIVILSLGLIEEPFSRSVAETLLAAKRVHQWHMTSGHCANCRGSTAGNNRFEVTGLTEGLSVLRPLFKEEYHLVHSYSNTVGIVSMGEQCLFNATFTVHFHGTLALNFVKLQPREMYNIQHIN